MPNNRTVFLRNDIFVKDYDVQCSKNGQSSVVVTCRGMFSHVCIPS